MSAASKILGQPVVVVNKPGGGSAVAVALLKTEKPDGYTIGILPSGAVLSQHMRKVPYDSAQDFTPIMQYAVYLYGLVVQSDSPWKTFKEFIDYAKANPGKIRYATAGAGTPQHLVMERLAIEGKDQMDPCSLRRRRPGGCGPDGGPRGGHLPDHGVEKTCGSRGGCGCWRSTGKSGWPISPMRRHCWNWAISITAPSLISIIGPKGLSPQVVDTLHGAFKKAMDDPDFIKVSNQMDQPLLYRGPQDLAKHLVQMNDEVGTLIRNLGLRKE